MRTTKNNGTFCEIDRLFLEKDQLEAAAARWGTPFFLYDEKGLRQNVQSLSSLFSGLPETKLYFPVRLCPRKEILVILAGERVGALCHTPEHLRLALEAGVDGKDILYSAVTMTKELSELLRDLDVTLLAAAPAVLRWAVPRRVDLAISLPLTRRVNFTNVGHHRDPVGLSRNEILELAPRLAEKGTELGLAIIEGRNTTAEDYFSNKLKSAAGHADGIAAATGVKFVRLNPGEGPGMSYNRTLPLMNAARAAALAAERHSGRREAVSISMGCRLIDPAAVFAVSVLDKLERVRPTCVVDASFDQVSIPGLERYRHMSVLGKDWIEGRVATDVVGCCALTWDWFAERRILPKTEPGDLIIFHDMGSAVVPGGRMTCLLRQQDGNIVSLEHGEE